MQREVLSFLTTTASSMIMSMIVRMTFMRRDNAVCAAACNRNVTKDYVEHARNPWLGVSNHDCKVTIPRSPIT